MQSSCNYVAHVDSGLIPKWLLINRMYKCRISKRDFVSSEHGKAPNSLLDNSEYWHFCINILDFSESYYLMTVIDIESVNTNGTWPTSFYLHYFGRHLHGLGDTWPMDADGNPEPEHSLYVGLSSGTMVCITNIVLPASSKCLCSRSHCHVLNIRDT